MPKTHAIMKKSKPAGKMTKSFAKATKKALSKVLFDKAPRTRTKKKQGTMNQTSLGSAVSHYRASLADPFSVEPRSLGLSGKETTVAQLYSRNVFFPTATNYVFAMAQPLAGTQGISVVTAASGGAPIQSSSLTTVEWNNKTAVLNVGSVSRPVSCGVRITYRGAMTATPPVFAAGLAPVETNITDSYGGTSWLGTYTFEDMLKLPFTKLNFAESNTATAVWLPSDVVDLEEFREATTGSGHRYYVPYVMAYGIPAGGVLEVEAIANIETVSGSIASSFYTIGRSGGRYTASELWNGYVKTGGVESSHFRKFNRSTSLGLHGQTGYGGRLTLGSSGNSLQTEEKHETEHKLTPGGMATVRHPMKGMVSRVTKAVVEGAEEASEWVLTHSAPQHQLGPNRFNN